MKLGFHVPLNPVSFGQVAIALLREAMKKNIDPYIFPIGKIDFSSNELDEEFKNYIQKGINQSLFFDRSTPCIKIWHLHGDPLMSPSLNTVLLSFYELATPTEAEIHVTHQIRTAFSSKFTSEVFNKKGAMTHFVPLGFDYFSFYETKKKYFGDGRIVFNVTGKYEHRKNHEKIVKSWIRKFGSDNRFYLNCALYNPHFPEEMNENIFRTLLEGKRHFNVVFQKWMPNNKVYNDFLNAGNIIIGMSGGEGWGLPEFQSLCLGKHGVIMNAHGYASWVNKDNAVLVEPKAEKISAVDEVWFKKEGLFNQGEIFDFDEDAFIAGCEEAIKRVKANPVNEEGRKLADAFSYEKMLDNLIKLTE